MLPSIQFHDDSLTEIEVFGLNSKHNLSDGHSYLDSETLFADTLASLPAIWRTAASLSIPEMERTFKKTFADFYGLDGLLRQTHFSICPTASNSIDIVGAWAKATNQRVGLIEPTFDNLALLLRRRGVHLESVREASFHETKGLEEQIIAQGLTSLFLVNPNNPTGRVVDLAKMQGLIRVCQDHDLTLILDTSFRFCHKHPLDEYRLLQEAKIPYVILEDTGKVWPTLDTKASLLSYSEDIAPLIRQIYEEIYLCSSNLSLALIDSFIQSTQRRGGRAFLHSILSSRLNQVVDALKDMPVRVENDAKDTQMSVVWLNIAETGMDDLGLVRYLAGFGLSVLPGRYFYWNSHQIRGHKHVRVALLKPQQCFNESLMVLRTALGHLNARRQSSVAFSG